MVEIIQATCGCLSIISSLIMCVLIVVGCNFHFKDATLDRLACIFWMCFFCLALFGTIYLIFVFGDMLYAMLDRI